MLDLINSFIDLISDTVVLIIGIAILAFFWGLAKSVFRVGGDVEAVESGRRIMKWGLAALFVMMSVWGIIAWFQRDLGVSQDAIILPGGRVKGLKPEVTEPLHGEFDPEIPYPYPTSPGIQDPGPGFPGNNV